MSRESGAGSQKNDTVKAFDRAAISYDTDFETLPSTMRLRRIIQSVLLTCFQPGDTILELNCGTGTDAIALAQRGVKVHATDISSGMIEIARAKSVSLGLDKLISTELLAFGDLDKLQPRQFDGAFSDMGGLNCTDDLKTMARELAALVRSRGYFVACIMPTFSIWETTAFLVRGKVSDAFRRLRTGGTLACIHGLPVRTFYHSVSDVKIAFAEGFEHVRTLGLNVFTPPPASRQAYNGLGSANRILGSIDDGIAGIPPFNRMGDHFLMVLRKK